MNDDLMRLPETMEDLYAASTFTVRCRTSLLALGFKASFFLVSSRVVGPHQACGKPCYSDMVHQ